MTEQGTVQSGLRECVMRCAHDPAIVDSFNRVTGFKLQAPIEIFGSTPPDNAVTTICESEAQFAAFILFVHERIWTRMNDVLKNETWRELARELARLVTAEFDDAQSVSTADIPNRGTTRSADRPRTS